jgi:hypothetical protein
VKLNKELLPAEKRTKEEMPMCPDSGVCHDIDLKNRKNETHARPVILDNWLS